MKKIILIISILVVSFCSCSLFSNEKSKDSPAIQKAKDEAVQHIENVLETKVKDAKSKIDSFVTDKISNADTTLNKKIQDVGSAMNQQAEAIKKELGDQIQGIEKQINKSYIIGFIGVFIGGLSLVIAILAYRKKPYNIEQVNNGSSNSCQQTDSGYIQLSENRSIIKEIDNYLKTKQFKEQLKIILEAQNEKTIQSCVSTETAHTNPTRTEVQCESKSSYEFYAKESKSMQLSSIQNSYQKGKSIYKLMLSSDDNMAQVTLCIEHEDAKERILAYDYQYLEPICSVSRLSNHPTIVEVKKMGMAERIGVEWKVTSPIVVEIK